MEYKILQGKQGTELEEKVNEAIKFGWEPQGGIHIDNYGYSQAMIKEFKEKE